MTETDARRKYKAEWARRNRARIKAYQRAFWEKKAAEYETAAEPTRLEYLQRELAAIEDKIAHPEKAIPDLKNIRRAMEIEIEKLKA